MVLKVHVQGQVMVSIVVSSHRDESMLEPVVTCPAWGGGSGSEEGRREKETHTDRHTQRREKHTDTDRQVDRQTDHED